MNILNRFAVWCLVTCCAVTPAVVFAGKSYSVVGRASGVLAVQEAAESPWRVVPAGGILPDVAEVRTSGDGPCQIHVAAGDSLFLAPLSRVKFDLTARRVQLLSGRVFTTAPEGIAWTVLAGGTTVEAQNSSVETVLLPGNGVSVTALHGQAKVSVPGAEVLTLAEKTSRSWRGNQPTSEALPLTKTQETQLASWTKPLPPGQGPGQLVITDPQSHSTKRLSIARYHAELVLRPPVALVRLDQAFYNPSNRQEEGEFVFNLPPGASVSRFAMYVTPTDLIEGEVIDRRRADQVYTQIVRGKRDPAILEKIGDNLFKMRVFPIFPKDIKRILLDYTLPLEQKVGQFHVQLPMLSDLEPIWDFRVQGSIQGPTPLASVQSATHPEVKFEARGPDEIGFDFAQRQYRPTSDFMVAFQQSIPERPTTFRALLAEPLKLKKDPNAQLDGRFTVLGPNGIIPDSRDRWNDQPATYFLAELECPKNDLATGPADVLVFIETSSTMRTLEHLRPAVQTVVSNLRDQDRFRLVCVDAAPRPLHEGWIKPRSPEAASAMVQFEQQLCMGTNDFLATCQSAAAQFAEPGAKPDQPSRRRLIVYIGDGLDTVNLSQDIPVAQMVRGCQAHLAKAQADFWAVEVHPLVYPDKPVNPNPFANRAGGMMGGGQGFFQFGGGVDPFANNPRNPELPQPEPNGRPLLNQLTAAVHGRCFDVAEKPSDSTQFFEWVLAGVPSAAIISDVKVASAEMGADVLAEDLYYPTRVLPGEPLLITGRIQPASRLRINYAVKSHNSVAVTQQVELTGPQFSQDHLVGRYWAEHRFEHLSRFLTLPLADGGDPKALDAVVRLSREWSLLTPYTAFLVLENEREYLTWGVPREARRQYWAAAGIPPVKALPATWLASAAPDSVLKAHRLAITKREPDQRELELRKARLSAAQSALAEGRLETAERILDQVRDPLVEDDADYLRLRQELVQSRLQAQALRAFGPRRDWFNSAPQQPLPLGIDSLLAIQQSAPASFLKRHPQGRALLKEVDLKASKMSIQEFGHWLQNQTSVHVSVNHASLAEETIPADRLVTLPALKKVPLYTVLSLVLQQYNLTCIEHPRNLEITTQTHGHSLRPRAFFPVQDLLSPRPRFDFTEFHDPLLDRQEAAEQRIKEKLRQVVKFQFTDGTLEQVADHVRRELDLNVFIKTHKLEEESIAVDTPDINIHAESLQMDNALQLALAPKNLIYRIEDEVLVLTTMSDGLGRRPVRFYPAMGLVHRTRNTPSEIQEIQRIWGGGGWGSGAFAGGGFGGMGQFGGGGFGGMMGGMGGGGFGGMGGGMGGGGMGGMAGGGNNPAPAAGNAPSGDTPPPPPSRTLSINDAPEADAPAHPDADPLVEQPGDEPPGNGLAGRANPSSKTSATAFDVRQNSNSYSMMLTLMQLTGGLDKGSPWMQIDGEGGEIGFFFPSMTFVVRQTEEAHEEIADYFREIRDVQAVRGSHPRTVPLTPREVMTERDYDVDAYPLMTLIQQLVGGLDQGSPWMQIDGEGGDLSYDQARYGIHITHDPKALDEVNALLINLRRERYAALYNARPWEHSVANTGLDLSLLPVEWITQSAVKNPVDRARPANTATAEELELLKVRKMFHSGTWSWTDANGRVQSPLSLQTSPTGRYRVTWPGREIQVDGPNAVVTATGLRFTEYGHWGQSVSEWLDVEIPCWPHRTNQELAAIYEISVIAAKAESDRPTTRKLRFVPVGFRDMATWIDVAFDLKSGLPTEWVAISRGRTTQRFTFTREPASKEQHGGDTLVSAAPSGAQGRWVPDAEFTKPEDLPNPPAIKDPAYVVFDRRTNEKHASTLPGLVDLREGRLADAARQFREVLKQQPDQPLVKFLLAWSLDQQQAPIPKEQVLAAFSDAIRSAPFELGTYVASRGARRLTSLDLYTILGQKPKEARTSEDEFHLATWLLNAGYTGVAVKHARAAWELKPVNEAAQFDVIHLLVNAQLRLPNIDEALKWTEIWLNGKTPRPLAQVKQLLDVYEAHGVSNQAARLYAELLQRKDALQLPPAERRDLLLWHAQAMHPHDEQRVARWVSLLTAYEMAPAAQPADARREMAEFLNELRDAPEATLDVLTKLVAQSKVPANRLHLLSVLADRTKDVVASTTLYWELYKSGFAFESNLTLALQRMDQVNQPEKLVAIAESRIRIGNRLTHFERELLSGAYQRLKRPEAAKRVRSVP